MHTCSLIGPVLALPGDPQGRKIAAAPVSLPEPAWRGGPQTGGVDPVRAFRTPASGVVKIRPADAATWIAELDFDTGFELDDGLMFVDRCRYEYRQFLRGAARYTRDGLRWESLPVEGLHGDWKADGAVADDRWQVFGLRPRSLLASACLGEAYEAPDATATFGSRYRLHRHLELGGAAPPAATGLELEIEVRAQVIEVSRDPDTDHLRTLGEVAARQWTCCGRLQMAAAAGGLRPA